MENLMTDLRAWMTVVQMAVFLLIVWWAFGRSRKQRFDEAARLVLDEDDLAPRGQERTRRH